MLDVLAFRRKLKQVSRKSLGERLQFQEHRFAKLVQQAQHYPFWQERLKNCRSIKNLSQIPPLTKKQLMDNFDTILTSQQITQANLKQFFQTAESAETFQNHFALRTSGTSGEITCIVLDQQDAQRMIASSMVFGTVPVNLKTMTKAILGKKLKVVSIILSQGHFPGTFYSHMMRRFVKVMDLVAHSQVVDIAQPIDKIISDLNTIVPDVWVTYPSMLRVLVQQVKDNKLQVLPKHLICTSEPLDPHTRKLAEKYLQCYPHDVYGSGECPHIASTCPQHRLHLRLETSILENVDENDQPVPIGEVGHHVLVTNLNAYTLPIIRFALDDRLAIDPETCSCGDSSPILKKIDGRTDDIFWLRDNSDNNYPIHPCALEPPLIADPRVKEYQIINDSLNHAQIRIATDTLSENLQKELPATFIEHLKTLDLQKILQYDFEFCKEIPRQISGKFRRFVSQVPPKQ